jgi:hypothetical protein
MLQIISHIIFYTLILQMTIRRIKTSLIDLLNALDLGSSYLIVMLSGRLINGCNLFKVS